MSYIRYELIKSWPYAFKLSNNKLLEETLDAGGRPLTTSPNALRDIVLPPSLLTKLLSAAGANINATFNSGGGSPFSSSIPWRKANVRHNANEIYFDMVEELNAIVNKYVLCHCVLFHSLLTGMGNRNGVALSSTVWGKIETNCRLSGHLVFHIKIMSSC